MNNEMHVVWVFSGAYPQTRYQFPSAVFSDREKAELWITKYQLSGTLTEYPLNLSVYEWEIQEGYLSSEEECDADTIQNYETGRLEHFHYEKGILLYQ